MLRPAQSTDFPGIAKLWQEAFGDSERSIRFFFDAFPDCLSWVAEEDGQIVSMVHGLPRILSPDTSAIYVYAVATTETHRGRGLCRQLMAFAEADAKNRGFACAVLTPGEPSLFRFYEGMGYRTAFTRNRTPFPGGRPISTEAYAEARKQLLTVPHLVCTPAFLDYAKEVYGLTFYKTATGIAAAGEGYTAEVLPEDPGGGPFAMIKWLGEEKPLKNAYLGFPLE